MSAFRAWLCAIRPPTIAPLVGDEAAVEDAELEQSWDQIEEAGVLVEPNARVIGAAEDVEEISADDHGNVQIPVPAPAPRQPSQAERDAHDATHIFYRSWCPHCVYGRRPSTQHRSRLRSDKRSVPLFCADYASARDAEDEEYAQLFIGRLYPAMSLNRIMFGTVCDSKGGEDAAVISRLATFFKETGIWKLVYKTDQESSIKVLVDAALRQTGRSGVFEAYESVPEYSAVGSSQSNGRAERAVQTVVDQIRTLKSALESRLDKRLPADHAVFRWLVEHTVSLINRFKVHEDGQTAYQALHGQRASEKVVEFGEQVFFSVPKRLRSKLCRRWRLGTYLGVVNSSNEHYVGLSNGNVVKARSVCRVVERSRWPATAVFKVIGTPSRMTPVGPEDIHPDIEQLQDPHVDRDHEDRLLAEGEHVRAEAHQSRERVWKAQPRITAKDHRAYGYTPGCPRCDDLQQRLFKTSKEHSQECRLRIYLSWKDNDDPKYLLVKHLIEPDDKKRNEPAVVNLDDDTHRRRSGSAQVEPDEPEPPERSQGSGLMTPPGRPWDEVGDGAEQEMQQIDAEIPDAVFDDPPPPLYSPFSPDGSPDQEMGESNPDAMVDALLADDKEQDRIIEDYLVILGVEKADARNHVCAMRSTRAAATFSEVYGGGSIVECANRSRRGLNIKGLRALDLRTAKPDGTPWDFSKRADRQKARQLIDEDDPDWLIGSPPCTAFSTWNFAMNYPKMSKDKVRDAIAAGRVHLNFVVSLYRKQMYKGKYFLHEHPATALSWKEDTVLALLKSPLVHTVVADQCMYGLTSPVDGNSSKRLPAMKPTRFMTNSLFMQAQLGKRCDHSHSHQQLVGGRARDAAFYPLPLVEAILQGIANQADDDHRARLEIEEKIATVNAVVMSAGTIPAATNPFLTSSCPRVSGGVLPISYQPECFKAKYIDEYTGEVLEPELIQAAIVEELNYFNERVWQIETRENMLKVPDHVFVRSRWINCNKGDANNPDIRARLVACEVNKGDKQDHYFASTPPLEAKKLLFAQYARERSRNGQPLRLSFIDVRKAYFNGMPKRPLYMAFPKEMGLPSNLVAKQVRCVYGTRDAGAIWEDTYRGALEEMGFASGNASPCCFYHQERHLSVVVHGDDFTTLGLDGDLDWFETELARNFELKLRGRLGEGTTDTELRILNRVVSITKDGLVYEADPRHSDLLVTSLGLTAANSTLTPGVKEHQADYELERLHESEASTDLKGNPLPDKEEADAICALSGYQDKSLEPTGAHEARKANTRVSRKMCFNDDVQCFDVTAYSVVFGVHPRFLVATKDGFKSAPMDLDPFTSKSGTVMEARRKRHLETHNFVDAARYRLKILQKLLLVGSHFLCSVSRPQNWTKDSSCHDCIAPTDFHTSHDTAFDTLPAFLGQRPSAQSKSQSRKFSASHVPGARCSSTFESGSRLTAVRTPKAYKPPGGQRAGAKAVKKIEQTSNSFKLAPEDATTFRALSARGNYLSQDRADIGFATKELCREFSAPTKDSQNRLKRLCRYLAGRPRVVHLFPWGTGSQEDGVLEVFVDTDFAGCKNTRRSTSGGICLLNGSNIRQWSKTQTTLALSSGEAELHGINAGIAQGLGLKSIAADLGFSLHIKVHTDASAAIGMCRRRGLGKVRHLDVADLWAQEKVRTKAIELCKIAGVDNPADMMTKHLDRATLDKHMSRVNMFSRDGRPACAPAAAGC